MFRTALATLLRLSGGLVGVAVFALLLPLMAIVLTAVEGFTLTALSPALILAVVLALSILGPSLIVLMVALIIYLQTAIFDRLWRRWFPSPQRQAAMNRPAGPMSAQDRVLDTELSKQIEYQLEELTSLRSEAVALTGFLALISGTTFALQGHALVSSIANLLLFLGAAFYGRQKLDDYPPGYADPSSLLEAVAGGEGLHMTGETPAELSALAYRGRAAAYRSNVVSIQERQRLLSVIRAIIAVAVLVLGGTAVAEAKPVKDAQALSLSIKTIRANDGSRR